MIENNKKEAAQEVSVQEQLNKDELKCIYRHLKMFVQILVDKKENVPDACIGCGHYCNKDQKVLDPWPTFYKLAKLSEVPSEVEKEHLSKQDNVPIHL